MSSVSYSEYVYYNSDENVMFAQGRFFANVWVWTAKVDPVGKTPV